MVQHLVRWDHMAKEQADLEDMLQEKPRHVIQQALEHQVTPIPNTMGKKHLDDQQKEALK